MKNLNRYFLFLILIINSSCSQNARWNVILKNDVAAPNIAEFGKRSDENLTHSTEIQYEVDKEYAGNFEKTLAKVIPISPFTPLYEKITKLSLDDELIPEEDLPPMKSGINGEGNRFWSMSEEDIPIKISRRIKLSVKQDLYTPEDIESFDVQKNDNPFAGWLSARVAEIVATRDTKEETGVEVGIVGRNSFAEETQTIVHELCGCDDPNGWANQLGTELGVILSHIREYREYENRNAFNTGLDIDVVSGSHIRIGNIHTDAEYKSGLRFGYNLPDLDQNPHDFSLYLFLDGRVRLIARNIFYDGNTFKNSHSIEKELGQVEIDTGVSVEYKKWRVTFQIRTRTRDYKEQDRDVHSFGLLSITRSW